LDPVCELFTKYEIGRDGPAQNDHSFPHDTRPHHALRLERLHKEHEYDEPRDDAQPQMVVLSIFCEPFEVCIPKKFGKCHEQYIEYGHPLYFQRKYFRYTDQMVPYLASWLSWVGDWGRSPNRFVREVILRILLENSLEWRVGLLTLQIRQLWPSVV